VIKKVVKLKNVGLFHHGCPNGALALGQTTAIYADNARGKSTFVAVLRACHMSDATRLGARRTIDVHDEPEVELLLENNAPRKYEDGAWIGKVPSISIFDSEFVEQNVYSGFAVRPDQRQKLLEFALGDTIIPLKNKVDELSRDIQEQTAKISEAEKLLSGLAAPLGLKQFIALEPTANAEDQIIKCQSRIGISRNAQRLNERSNPTTIKLLDFDLYPIFDILSRQLADIENTTEAMVKSHLDKHGEGFEDWISQGRAFLGPLECPFCGQRIIGLELIAAYQSYFNKAYHDLKDEVAKLETTIMSSLADSVADSAVAAAATNAARIEAWKDQLEVNPPKINENSVKELLENVRNVLIPLAQRKHDTPLESVGTWEDVKAADQCITAINQVLTDYNSEVAVITSKIVEFKAKLVTEDIRNLETEIIKLQASIKKQQPEAVRAYSDYQSAITEKKRLEQEKDQTREQIDTLMREMLTKYQNSINSILETFGATFFINRLSTDYRGRVGEPRTQYILGVRNHEVELGGGSDFTSGPNFTNTLSESDKRTLALAFFIARLEGDPALGSKIVVLDDPMSSMDRNRRYHTILRIASLANKCKQLLVLSHDEYFVRELRDRLHDLKPTPVTLKVLKIARVEKNYSAFCDCDLDELCESDYYRHYRMVAEYAEGTSSDNIRDVAKAIRPMLEGYLYRRFPEHIPRNLMFGKMISDHIEPATSGPLMHLQQHVIELREINEYASQFHHEPNENANSAIVVDAELLQFARRSLDMIYRNG
jgi:wobble nucleotide-excising tRNase